MALVRLQERLCGKLLPKGLSHAAPQGIVLEPKREKRKNIPPKTQRELKDSNILNKRTMRKVIQEKLLGQDAQIKLLAKMGEG